jgi:hypothetical protein
MRRSRKEISDADSRMRPSSFPPGIPYPFTPYEMYAITSSRMPKVCNARKGLRRDRTESESVGIEF